MPAKLSIASFCLVAALYVGAARAADDAAPDPAELLARHGLKRLDRVWVLEDEIRLRQALAELPKRREKLLGLEHDVEERIQRNHRAWQEAQPALAALRKSLNQLATDDPQRVLVQQQIEGLLAAASEPVKFGARGQTRARVVQWIDERHGLAAAIAQIRRTIDALGGLYDRLAQQPGVAEAIRQVGQRHRLGPQRSYAGDRDKLGEYERLIFTPWVPIFFQGSQLRLPALLDDRAPVTFTWLESGGSGIVLTRTAAEAAGLSIPAGAPRETISRSSEERAVARRIQVARLRLGKCVLPDVSVLVLPPEAEDWGCQFSRDALSGHSVKIEPERLRLTIDSL